MRISLYFSLSFPSNTSILSWCNQTQISAIWLPNRVELDGLFLQPAVSDSQIRCLFPQSHWELWFPLQHVRSCIFDMFVLIVVVCLLNPEPLSRLRSSTNETASITILISADLVLVLCFVESETSSIISLTIQKIWLFLIPKSKGKLSLVKQTFVI